MKDKELIWVEKEFAEKYIILESEKNKNEERIKALDEYIEKIKDASKQDFKANLESLEEDVAIYTGLMLKVKQAFGKAKEEQLNASYELWENFDKELPRINEKINKILEQIKPLEEKINTINTISEKIRTWNIDRLSESLIKISNLYNQDDKLIKFLLENYSDLSMHKI